MAPDFVIELASPSDSPTDLRQKMLKYRENGVKLGWLILPEAGIVEVYRDHSDEEMLQRPETLSGETVLPGFTLSLAAIWP